MSLSSLIICGVNTGQTWPYYLAVGVAGAHMFNQVIKYKLLIVNVR
jgi:hypothetical protein